MKYLLAVLAVSLAASVARADEPVESGNIEKPALRSELLERMKVDQDARLAWIEWTKKSGHTGTIILSELKPEEKAELDKLTGALEKIDKENTGWLKELVAKSGWPTKTQVGDDGAHAAWLLVQHADAEPKFQRQCLDLMTRLPKEQVSLRNVALLTDRVLLHEGKKQIYGTQFEVVEGRYQPRPLEDEANVDRRRAEMGLEPLAEYAKGIEKTYGSTPK
jgi:uncharacterized protein DUF6624